jgi:predicted dienelactone hydrolase
MNLVIALLLATVCCVADGALLEQPYDPSRRPDSFQPVFKDLSIRDASRSREIPIRVYLPQSTQACPVVLFSHGLGGSRRGCGYLGTHWSARGYVVVFLQHTGSDESVWKDQPLRQRLAALRSAASAKNTLARFQDVGAVLDQLGKWQESPDHPLAGRLDMQLVGMSGHSYGAVTTQAVSGQAAPRIGQRFTDKRIRAALILSPSLPRRGDARQAFAQVAIPWMLMTGTRDNSPIDDSVTPESRAKVFPALPDSIDRYQLVLHDGHHYAFSDGGQPRRRESRNPNHHRAILALSTAFWDAHLRQDADARGWLHGPKARGVLQQQDRWQVQTQTAAGSKQ